MSIAKCTLEVRERRHGLQLVLIRLAKVYSVTPVMWPRVEFYGAVLKPKPALDLHDQFAESLQVQI